MPPTFPAPTFRSTRIFIILVLLVPLFFASSYSQGTKWETKNKGLDGRAVFSLAYGTQGEVYAGSWADEIFKSTDDGLSWMQVTFGKNSPKNNPSGTGKILTILVDKAGVVFAGGESGVVFRSDDHGSTWAILKTPINNPKITAIVKDSIGNLFVGTANTGVIRSTDNGQTWEIMQSGFTATVLVAGRHNELFAASQSHGVLHSTDTGKTWAEIAAGLPGIAIEALYVDSSGDLIAGSQQGIFKLRSGEKKWATKLAYRYAKEFTKAGSDIIAISNTSGNFFQSSDEGETWSQFIAKDIASAWMNTIVTTTNGHLLVGTEVYGIFRSTDLARHWRETNSGLANPYVVMVCRLDKRTIIAGLRMEGIYASTDDGESWSHRSFSWQNITGIASGRSGYTFAIVDQPHARFQRSDDNGETWSFFTQGLPDCELSTLLINKKGNIFLGTTGFGVFFSEDNAEHWADRNRGLANMDIQKMIVTKNNAIIAITSGGIFRSVNDGKQWRPSSLQGIQVLSVYESMRGALFAGTNGDGIYTSEDDGAKWTKTSFPSVTVTRLGEASGVLYATTYGEGTYHSSNAGNTWQKIESEWPTDQITAFTTDLKGNLLLGTYGLGIVKVHPSK
ncbi:MAG: YCF48-related protein [Bacteroidota bacterium]